jgi:CRISPR system Cascade subunit CasD
MATLLLRLQAPMQSWGTTSRFDERDTQLEPSKSGVLGLVCAAIGRDRAEAVDDLAALRMGVRVDREGVPMRDYQTATGYRTADGTVMAKETVVSPRHYLSDACFLVGLEGEDRELLGMIHQGLRAPVWPMAFGRKSFVPAAPVWLPDGLSEADLKQALSNYPSLTPDRPTKEPRRLLLENATSGAVRLDQPVAPYSQRRFGPRFVETTFLAGEADVPGPIEA